MKKIISIIFLLTIICFLSACGPGIIIDPYVYDDTNYKIGNMTFTETINMINVDWIVGDIVIQKSETEEIIIREDVDVNIDDSLKMHYYLNEGTLDIKFCGNLQKINYDYKVKKLYIYLPSSSNLKKIDINNISADISIKNVNINSLDIENISGDIDVEKVNINSLDIDNTSGSILLFYSNIDYIEIESVSGTVGISYDKKPTTLSIESVSGGISIYISEKENISFSFETVSGNFKTNIQYIKEKDIYKFNDGTDNFSIETVSGYFKVLKK